MLGPCLYCASLGIMKLLTIAQGANWSFALQYQASKRRGTWTKSRFAESDCYYGFGLVFRLYKGEQLQLL